ncbi:MAG: tRNA adenosine(34) deaminase TadA [Candidatus Thiosymbion ectosymbiont of Robbea hypermnestra]|nr:tRNA adenosine(34) deaminase TadA [Candidatus Thiosymbion ectosymbiont of Robbea hypermnestra]
MSSAPSDEEWMRRALSLAELAATMGEVPVGAILVQNGKPVGAGWNRPLAERDPSAHAEILALRDAGRRLGNYRLPGTRLYVTLEPCVMCAGAIVQARVERVFFAAADPKGGACGSVFDLLPADARFNHRTDCTGGLLGEESGELLQSFFRARR